MYQPAAKSREDLCSKLGSGRLYQPAAKSREDLCSKLGSGRLYQPAAKSREDLCSKLGSGRLYQPAAKSREDLCSKLGSGHLYQPAAKPVEDLRLKPGLSSGKWTLVLTCSKVCRRLMCKAGKCANLQESLKKTRAQSRGCCQGGGQMYQPAVKSDEDLCSKPGPSSGKCRLVRGLARQLDTGLVLALHPSSSRRSWGADCRRQSGRR